MHFPHDLDPASLLKEARTAAGLSQRALAERAGTSQSVVARIESGATSPTVNTLRRLLDAAGARVELRFDRSGPVRDRNGDALGRRIGRHFAAREEPGIVSVYLFGSAARGQMHRESDVDVGVLVDPATYPTVQERTDLRIRLVSDLVQATGMGDVDLSVLNDVPPTLARAVVLDGARVYLGDAEQDHAFIRDVQLRAADLEPFLRRTRRIKLERLRR